MNDACRYVKAFRLAAKSDADPRLPSEESALSLSVRRTLFPSYTRSILPLLGLFAKHPMDVRVLFPRYQRHFYEAARRSVEIPEQEVARISGYRQRPRDICGTFES
jgi:hypothetical protein